jgi:segregation and condensation protein A
MEKEEVGLEQKIKPSVKQEEIHDLLFSRELGWQEIIYDLINTEQLDPWDINITILAEKFLEKINKLEEADFFVSSKVLLAAALLLKIKSEILLSKYIMSIDEILFGKKEKKEHKLERIELEEEIPSLIPRSPMPRFRKVTLKELMESLNKAISTENRRIRKAIIHKNSLRESAISLPKSRFSIKDRIHGIYERLIGHFDSNKNTKKISYTEFVGVERTQRITSFFPLLHLENQRKVWLQQEGHFNEIDIWLREIYVEHNGEPFAELREEFEKEMKNLDKKQKQRLEEIDEKFSNPLGE